jgi:outer membrane lipoprotein-sorting protein
MKKIILLLGCLSLLLLGILSVSCDKEEETVPDELSVSPASLHVETASGSHTIAVTSNVSWTASDNAAWLTLSPASGKGNGTITVAVTENTTTAPRSATITVKAGDIAETVTVTQAGTAPLLEVDGTALENIPEGAASYSLPITSNLSWTAEKSNADWLTLTPAEGTGNGTITVAVTENTATAPRTATITVTAGDIAETVTVTQTGTAPLLEVDGTALENIPEGAASYSLPVTSNLSWTAEKSNADWLTLTPASGNGNGTITVAVTENTATAPRTATITVTAGTLTKTVTVTQEGTLSETMEFTFTGNKVTFAATAQNMVVDWGDGATNEYVNVDAWISYTYQNNASHTVQIQAKKLSYFNCNDQHLTALDVSGCTKLTQLVCYWNQQLTALDVSHNTKLTYLSCGSNRLTTLNVSNNTELTYLHCSQNQLAALDVSRNTELTTLECYTNQLTALDVSRNTELTTLNCNQNQLTALDVSRNTELTTLYCGSNQLTALDVSHNTKLTWLQCSGNQLTALDVSHNTKLTQLRCGWNPLTALTVSNNTELTELMCQYNQLTTLDVSSNTELTTLNCYGNQLTAAALNALFTSLPTVQSGEIDIRINPGAATCNRSIATNKGWSFED